MRRPTLLVAVVATAALAGAATWRAVSTRDALYARTTRRLDGNAAGTVAAVERWIEERRYDAATVSEEVDSLAPHLSAPDVARRETARASLRHVLHRLRTGHGYVNAWAIDSGGQVIAAAEPGIPSAPERDAVRRALAGHGAQLCDPFLLPTGKPALCYAVAVRDAGGRHEPVAAPAVLPAFVIVLRSNPLGSLMPLVTASDVEGSEQTYLVGRSGDSLALIATAGIGRHPRTSVEKLPWARAPELVRAAAGGTPSSGAFRSLDGSRALGAARPVRGTRWAVVRRVSLGEILPALWRQLWTELLLLGAALAAAALAVLSATRAERNRRLREVAASETRLADTLRSSFDAVIAVDDAVRIQLFNAAAERLFRRPAAEMLGRPATGLFPARYERFHDAGFRAFLAGAESSRSIGGGPEFVAVREDGEEFPFEAIVTKGVADGRRLSTVILRDVSERRRAEEERERSLSLLRATLESTADGILVVSTSGHIVAHNRQFADIWRIPPEVLAGKDDERFLQAALGSIRDPDAFLTRVHDIYGAPERESVDVIEFVDGRLIERLSRPQRIGERVVGRVWSFRDVTERERATAALRQSEKLAAVGQFVSGVAHELNNPLSAVLLFTEQMLEEPRADDDLETLTLVRDQARRARAIVRDLLAFVRNASGELTTVDARELLEQAAHALDRQIAAGGEGGRVVLHAAAEVGAVRVDRAAVEQVVTNLVLNAAHAAPGREVRVVASAGDAGVLAVAVEDEGPGIPPDVLPRLFEPFFTTKPVGQGTGLGLSVSLGIAQRHGGTLRAENRPGGGARLVLTLPLVERETARATPVPAAAPAADAPRRRVLLVDDEPPVRRALRGYFARRDWEVEEAAHGGPALRRLLDDGGAEPFDLIISDLRMPGVSGAALHDRLAAARPELLDRLVIATGDVVSADAAAFVARTRCVVLEKPFEPSALDAMLRAIVAQAAAAAAPA